MLLMPNLNIYCTVGAIIVTVCVCYVLAFVLQRCDGFPVSV